MDQGIISETNLWCEGFRKRSPKTDGEGENSFHGEPLVRSLRGQE